MNISQKFSMSSARPSRIVPSGPFDYIFAPTRLQYREEGASTWTTLTGQAMNLPGLQWIVHTVKIPKDTLTPNTTIEVRLPTSGSDAFAVPQMVYFTYCEDPTTSLVVHWLTVGPIREDYTIYSTTFNAKSFTQPATLGPGEPYRCVQMSDTHGDETSVPLFAHVGTIDAKLIIHSGDMATGDGGVRPGGAGTWTVMMQALDGAIDTQGRRIPILPCAGNHENVGGSSGRLRRVAPEPFPYKPNFEENQRGWMEWYYGFFPTFPALPDGFGVLDFGDYMSVWILDPVSSTLTNPDPALGDIEQDQAAWLDSTLAARQHIPNRFCSLHFSPYPSGRRVMAGFIRNDIRSTFGPIWQARGVQCVFVGHEHTLSRTVPIGYWAADGHQTVQEPVAGGVVFVGGGPGRYGATAVGAREGRNPETKWWISPAARARIFNYFAFEQPTWTGTPGEAELRDPHPGDGTEFDNADICHFVQVDLGYSGRTIQFVTANGDVADSFAQTADLDLSGA
jgi:hypothetical protein